MSHKTFKVIIEQQCKTGHGLTVQSNNTHLFQYICPVKINTHIKKFLNDPNNSKS